MTAACLPHLEVLRAWAWLYLDTALAEEPDLPGTASNESIIAFKTLNAHESWNAALIEARGDVLLFVVLPRCVLKARCESDLKLCCLRSLTYSLNCAWTLQRLLRYELTSITAQKCLLVCPM